MKITLDAKRKLKNLIYIALAFLAGTISIEIPISDIIKDYFKEPDISLSRISLYSIYVDTPENPKASWVAAFNGVVLEIKNNTQNDLIIKDIVTQDLNSSNRVPHEKTPVIYNASNDISDSLISPGQMKCFKLDGNASYIPAFPEDHGVITPGKFSLEGKYFKIIVIGRNGESSSVNLLKSLSNKSMPWNNVFLSTWSRSKPDELLNREDQDSLKIEMLRDDNRTLPFLRNLLDAQLLMDTYKENGDFPPKKMTSLAIDKNPQLFFPISLSSFVRTQITTYDGIGLGVSAQYAHNIKQKDYLTTIIRYDKGIRNIGSGLESKHVISELERSKKDILSFLKKKNVNQIADRQLDIKIVNDKTLKAYLIGLEFPMLNNGRLEDVHSYLILTGYKDKFLKIRFTFPKKFGQKGERELMSLISEFGKSLD